MTAQQQQQEFQHNFKGDVCQLQLFLEPQAAEEPPKHAVAGGCKRVENIRNCDIFVEDFNLFIYADVHLYKFHCVRQLDVKDMKQLVIKYSSTQRCLHLELPCLPQYAQELVSEKVLPEKGELDKKSAKCVEDVPLVGLWKLKRITENCRLQLDGREEQLQFVANFDYGFAGKFKGKINVGESDMSQITRIPEPYLSSPLQRKIDREIDEMKSFSREQYKLNFVELQVPEGHDNPIKFHVNFNESALIKDEENLLHNLTCKARDLHMPDIYDQTEVDCGLINILLAICYDVRSTANEPTCESAWTRSSLSATLTYFEPFECLKDVVINFLRRSLIYPLYRNYDYGRICVQDAIDALQKSPAWILKQLLITHELFATGDCSREAFNRYYIEDYIRYISNGMPCTLGHLQMLARNLKNVLLDVNKKHLHLDLFDIEKELLQELVEDIHLNGTTSGEESSADDDDDEDDDGEDDDGEGLDVDDGTESGEDERETSSASEVEENSVIEQRMDGLRI